MINKENLDEKPYQYSISKLINDVLVDKKKDLAIFILTISVAMIDSLK